MPSPLANRDGSTPLAIYLLPSKASLKGTSWEEVATGIVPGVIRPVLKSEGRCDAMASQVQEVMLCLHKMIFTVKHL